jgi:uncharacterized protein YggE
MARLTIIGSSLLVSLVLGAALLASMMPLAHAAPAAPSAAAVQALQLPAQPVAQNSITVIGEGTASAQPDQAWLAVGVQVRKPTAAEALTEASQATEAVLTKLNQLGIARGDVQTSGISLVPLYAEGPRPQPAAEPALTGYGAVNQLTVLVRDLNQVGHVLDEVVAAGATMVGGVRFGLSDDRAVRAQALDAAVRAAQPKAEALAAGLHLQVGEVLAVREEASFSPVPVAQLAAGKGGDVPIEPGQLTAQVRVQVSFALVPAP